MNCAPELEADLSKPVHFSALRSSEAVLFMAFV